MKKITLFILVLFLLSGCTKMSPATSSPATESNISGSSDITIYYNNPLRYQAPSSNSDSAIGTALIDLLNSATTSIDFALYGLRNQPEIVVALEDALDRGVIIRGVVDKDIFDNNYYDDTENLISIIKNISTDHLTDCDTLNNPIDFNSNAFWPSPSSFEGPPQMVGYSLKNNQAIIAVHASLEPIDFEGDIMHNKFFIVDSRKVWTGSTNASDTGTGGYNANIACIIDNGDIAELYVEEFLQMYEKNLFHNDKASSIRNRTIYFDEETMVNSYFSPQDNVIPTAIIPLIKSAEANINLPVFYLTDKAIAGELIKAHQRGVKVKVIIDATSAQNGYSKHEILRAAGIPVKVENWGGKMHMKSMVVDEKFVVVGSMNFTSAGTYNNDENTLIIQNAYYAAEANEFFDILWESIPDKYLRIDPSPESEDSTNSMVDGIDNDFDSLVDSNDSARPTKPMMPPYQIVPKTDGYNLIKGIENKNGFLIYVLPNDKYYDDYLVNQANEYYFPSIAEAKAAGFEAFNYKKHILME